jgi:hypothetical protein
MLALAIAGALALTVILAGVIKVSLDEDAATPATKPPTAMRIPPPPPVDINIPQHSNLQRGKSDRPPDDDRPQPKPTPVADQLDRTSHVAGIETAKDKLPKTVPPQPAGEPGPLTDPLAKVGPVEADPIKEKLDKAKADYKAEMDQQRQVILKRLEEAKERAIRDGNKKDWDRIDEEILAFEKEETLPTKVPSQDFRHRRNQARARLRSAYAIAVSDYTKARKRTEADEVEKEQERFERDGPADGSPAEFVPLFDGKSLNGWRWQDLPDAKWLVMKGVIVGWNQRRIGDGPRTLETDKLFTNFELYLEAKQSEGKNNSGITFRGLTVVIASAQLAFEPYPTGTVWVEQQNRILNPAPADHSRPGAWITIEVKATGDRCQVRRNGQPVADCRIDNLGPAVTNAPTRIALQCRPQSTVQFRNIKIKELPPPGAP